MEGSRTERGFIHFLVTSTKSASSSIYHLLSTFYVSAIDAEILGYVISFNFQNEPGK